MEEKLELAYQEYVKYMFNRMITVDKEDDLKVYWREVQKGNKYVLLKQDNARIKDYEFDEVYFNCSCGLTIVKNNSKYNYINRSGYLISDDWFDDAKPFSEDRAAVRVKNKWFFINKDGKRVSNSYKSVDNFKNGYAWVELPAHGNTRLFNAIDLCGRSILKKPISEFNKECMGEIPINKNFSYLSYGSNTTFKELFCKTKYLGDYVISKNSRGYYCYYFIYVNSFDIKYEPLVIYDKKYALCLNNEDIYLYNISTKTYQELGEIRNIIFNEDFIFDTYNDKVYFIYDGEIRDITDYYRERFGDEVRDIRVEYRLDILSKEVFSLSWDGNIEKAKIKKEVRKAYDEIDKKVKDENYIPLETFVKMDDKDEMEVSYVSEPLTQATLPDVPVLTFNTGTEVVKESNNGIKLIEAKNLYKWVNDHYEFLPVIVENKLFKYLDLSKEKFTKVKMSDIDFGEAILPAFDPQNVYNKDLSNSNLESVLFPLKTSFKDVNISGCRFSNNQDFPMLCINEYNLAEGIYDDNTTLNGEPLVELLDKINHTR